MCVCVHKHVCESVQSYVYVCTHGKQRLTMDVSPQVPSTLSFEIECLTGIC